MIEFCEENSLPLDFITTHHYPSDDPLWRSGMTDEDFFASGGLAKMGKYKRGVLKEMTIGARQEAGDYPLIYTEWNISGMIGRDRHDDAYSSAMIAKVIADNDGLVEGYSFFVLAIFLRKVHKCQMYSIQALDCRPVMVWKNHVTECSNYYTLLVTGVCAYRQMRTVMADVGIHADR